MPTLDTAAPKGCAIQLSRPKKPDQTQQPAMTEDYFANARWACNSPPR